MRRTQSLLLIVALVIITGYIVLSNDSQMAGITTNQIPVPQQNQQVAVTSDRPTATFAITSIPPTAELSSGQNPTNTPGVTGANEIFAPPNPSNASVTNNTIEGWNPPALEVPLARHPWDHYWFIRPVSSEYNNFALQRYPYGSNGPADDMITHHGIDLSNDTGVEIYAAAGGKVVNAGDGLTNADEPIGTYGNVVVIHHDIGWQGMELYTLYAHMSVVSVEVGQRVETGDTLGLVGSTGGSTGPHVHFEVRLGRNSYYAVRNPVLWMAPYAGSGSVAGRLELPNGTPAQDVDMWLVDDLSGQIYYRTTTYAGSGSPSDDNWDENFIFGDVRVGTYEVIADSGGLRWVSTVNVVEGVTNWVDLEIDDDFEPTPEPTGTP